MARNSPQFKELYTECFDSVHKLSTKLFRLMALSLNLDKNYFDDFGSDLNGISIWVSKY